MTIQRNIPLAPFTAFGIGGSADFFIKVQSIDELIEAIEYAKENNLPFFVLGTGANILIGDKGFRGVVIKNEAKKIQLLSERTSLRTSSETGEAIPKNVQKQRDCFVVPPRNDVSINLTAE